MFFVHISALKQNFISIDKMTFFAQEKETSHLEIWLNSHFSFIIENFSYNVVTMVSPPPSPFTQLHPYGDILLVQTPRSLWLASDKLYSLLFRQVLFVQTRYHHTPLLRKQMSRQKTVSPSSLLDT